MEKPAAWNWNACSTARTESCLLQSTPSISISRYEFGPDRDKEERAADIASTEIALEDILQNRTVVVEGDPAPAKPLSCGGLRGPYAAPTKRMNNCVSLSGISDIHSHLSPG